MAQRAPSPDPAIPADPGPLGPNLRALGSLLRAAAVAWVNDRAPSMGAALAYYTLFSLAPLLLIAISVAGAVFGIDAARGEILEQMRLLLGTDGAVAIAALLDNVRRSGQSTLGTVVGVVLLVVGATTVFAELQDALDHIWRVDTPRRGGGLWQLLRARLLSFGLVLGVGFLLMVSLAASAALAAWGRWWAPAFGGSLVLLDAANHVLGFVLTTLLFAAIYKGMPRARIGWADVMLGSLITAVLFTLGKSLIAWLLTRSGLTAGFGAASAIVGLLVWVYASAQVFLYGAEVTWMFAQRHGSRRVVAPVPEAAPPAAPATSAKSAT
ncbi:YihY/virulence factor BrkB family protein [Rubrivivax sp. RP6-9]|uniref:YihY/virulence factor BrkB family protein n=1 Tax=Rubrivivax sp. RP6-9 TaxID=3415750 RepID=UPI003CC5CDF7